MPAKSRQNKMPIRKTRLIIMTNILVILVIFVFITGNQNIGTKELVTINQISNKEMSTSTSLLGDYIIADLGNMQISLISQKDGIKTFPIITKGKPGSYYETPVGEYTATAKETNHFSRLGSVYMPYSIQFYANFFIHGIPYHPNGTRVSSAYSGGCIRLADVDAKQVFDFAKRDMKIIVLNRQDDQEPLYIEKERAENLLFALATLESTNQEKFVVYDNKKVQLKEITEQIANGDTEARNIVYSQLGKSKIDSLVKEKAVAIGISDITFENKPDREKLLTYISNYKTFLLKFL